MCREGEFLSQCFCYNLKYRERFLEQATSEVLFSTHRQNLCVEFYAVNVCSI